MNFAYVFDAGPFRVRKYESVVIGLGTRSHHGQSYGEAGDQPACRVTQCTSQIRCSHSYKNSAPCGQTAGGDRAPRIHICVHIHTLVYILTHIYTCIFVRIHPHIYIHTYIHIYFYAYIYIQAHAYIRIYVYTHIHTHASTYIYIYAFIYIIYIYTYPYAYIYIHAHTYTSNPTWGDITECCHKAQSSKLEHHFSLKRGKRDVRALSLEPSKMTPQVH